MPEELCQVCCKSHYGSLALHSDPNPYGAISRLYSDLSCTNVGQVIKTDQTWSLRQSTRKEIINQICIVQHAWGASKTLLDR